MRTYMAILASLTILATTAFGKGWTAPPTGVDKTAAYISPADNGIQATWAAQYRIDHQTLGPIPTSTAPGATVVLTAGRGGGAMRGGFSGRANVGQGFHARPFGGRSFDRDRSFHRDFDRDRFLHRDRFFDRDDFFFHGGFGYYPYGSYYYYPYSYGYSYPYGYYPYGYYYGNPWYSYPYSSFYFSW